MATPEVPVRSDEVRRGRALCLGFAAAALALIFGVPFLGSSPSTPPLGARTLTPPYDLDLHPDVALVAAGLVIGYALAGAAVWFGLRAVGAGWCPRARRVLPAALAIGLLALLVPPFGSADHLSYLAYGRISHLGGDPYSVAPSDWPAPDPVIAAAENPWRDTVDVYGPVATGLFWAAAVLGGGTVRTTVAIWQLITVLAFLLTYLMLHRLAAGDRRAQGRVAVLWALNPVLAGVLLGGAHLDSISTAAVVAVIWLMMTARAGPLHFVLAGAAVAVAGGTKLPYLVLAVTAYWVLSGHGGRSRSMPLLAGLGGAAVILVPAHVWAGPHIYDQAQAAGHYVSIASPWRIVVNLVELVTGPVVRALVPYLFVVLAVLVAGAGYRWLCRSAPLPQPAQEASVAGVARLLLVLSLAYPVAAPYVLPWYDAPLWAALALVAVPTRLEMLLLLQLVALAVAYVPGRGEVPEGMTADVMLGVRYSLAPLVVAALLVTVLVCGLRRTTTAKPAKASVRATMATPSSQSGVPHSHDH